MNTMTASRKASTAPTKTVKNSLIDKYLLELEDVCARLLEMQFASRGDTERIIWQQRFKNIVTSVSLALSEIKGPRKFHFHYRHDAKDDSLMRPVLENPIDLLAHSCEMALAESARKLSGVHDGDLVMAWRNLESALRNFLLGYRRESKV